jgi:hypothetical protein
VVYFDPPTNGHKLFVPGYLTVNSLVYGLQYDQTTGLPMFIQATVGVQNVDYVIESRFRPITEIAFRRWSYPYLPLSVQVIGNRGYTALLDNAVWQAILDGATWKAWSLRRNAQTGGLDRVNMGGDLEVRFAEPGKAHIDQLLGNFKAAAANRDYRLFTL